MMVLFAVIYITESYKVDVVYMCLYLLLLPLLVVLNPKINYQNWCQSYQLCFLLGVFWFLILHSVWFFCLQFSSFHDTIYWRGFIPLYILIFIRGLLSLKMWIYFWALYSVPHRSTDLCAFFYATTMLFWLWHCCSVTQSCLTICNPMDCRKPDFPVLHHLLKFAQTHVHWVSDDIQPSHPLSLTPPPAFNLAQHQGIFQWSTSLHQVAKVLELQLQHQSFQWIFRVDFLWDWLVWSRCCPRDS